MKKNNPHIIFKSSILLLIFFILSSNQIYSSDSEKLEVFSISSSSMKPGLNIGDAITVDVNYYYNNKLQRGDIILYSAPIEGNKSLYIHRCIALPGDKFSIKNNAVFINDKKLEELYTIGITEYDFDKRNLEGIVPKNMVIILGDNRENSMDSRYYLYVPIKNIKGKYIKKIIKFNVST